MIFAPVHWLSNLSAADVRQRSSAELLNNAVSKATYIPTP